MAGTITKLSGMGYLVQPIVATLPNFVETDRKEERKAEAIRSTKVMGCLVPEFLDLSPDEIIFGRKFVTLIDSIVKKYSPEDCIYSVERGFASRSSSFNEGGDNCL